MLTEKLEPMVLTGEGRRMLEPKEERLREQTIPELRKALTDPKRDRQVDADFERAVAKHAQLEYVLRHAKDTADMPDDPEIVEVGEEVSLQSKGKATERYIVVHPFEASLDDRRISWDSPLAQAILGRRIGEEVDVRESGGLTKYRILAAKRVVA